MLITPSSHTTRVNHTLVPDIGNMINLQDVQEIPKHSRNHIANINEMGNQKFPLLKRKKKKTTSALFGGYPSFVGVGSLLGNRF
jgi:hypothetical protein